MFGQLLLAFREALEAALVIAIIFAYLKRTKKTSLLCYVWRGVFLAAVASLVFGTLIWFLYEGLAESSKTLFEGITAFLAVFALSLMIYWMATKGKELKIKVERRMETILTRGATLALTSFSFFIVFREGFETVLFLTPFLLVDVTGTLVGAVLGILASVTLAYTTFAVGMRINIRKLFYFTSLLLVLLAGGLAGYGVHELSEYSKENGIKLGWLGEPAYDLNISGNNPLHHKGVIGSIFAVVFGYTVKAEWARVIVHAAYLIIVLPLVIQVYKKKDEGKTFKKAITIKKAEKVSYKFKSKCSKNEYKKSQ